MCSTITWYGSTSCLVKLYHLPCRLLRFMCQVPRNCADAAFVQSEGDVLAYGCSYRLLLKQQFWFTNNQWRYSSDLFFGAITLFPAILFSLVPCAARLPTHSPGNNLPIVLEKWPDICFQFESAVHFFFCIANSDATILSTGGFAA
jgi:hypothetical protein